MIRILTLFSSLVKHKLIFTIMRIVILLASTSGSPTFCIPLLSFRTTSIAIVVLEAYKPIWTKNCDNNLIISGIFIGKVFCFFRLLCFCSSRENNGLSPCILSDVIIGRLWTLICKSELRQGTAIELRLDGILHFEISVLNNANKNFLSN